MFEGWRFGKRSHWSEGFGPSKLDPPLEGLLLGDHLVGHPSGLVKVGLQPRVEANHRCPLTNHNFETQVPIGDSGRIKALRLKQKEGSDARRVRVPFEGYHGTFEGENVLAWTLVQRTECKDSPKVPSPFEGCHCAFVRQDYAQVQKRARPADGDT